MVAVAAHLGGSCTVQAMRRKGQIPKAGDSDESEPCWPGLSVHLEGEAAGVQELSEPFTQAELQQEPLSQLCIPDLSFHQAESFICLNGQAVGLNSCS